MQHAAKSPRFQHQDDMMDVYGLPFFSSDATRAWLEGLDDSDTAILEQAWAEHPREVDRLLSMLDREDMEDAEGARDFVHPNPLLRRVLGIAYWGCDNWFKKSLVIWSVHDAYDDENRAIMLDFLRAPFPDDWRFEHIEFAKDACLGYLIQDFDLLPRYPEREQLERAAQAALAAEGDWDRVAEAIRAVYESDESNREASSSTSPAGGAVSESDAEASSSGGLKGLGLKSCLFWILAALLGSLLLCGYAICDGDSSADDEPTSMDAASR
jgi:hypothetical protein